MSKIDKIRYSDRLCNVVIITINTSRRMIYYDWILIIIIYPLIVILFEKNIVVFENKQ